MRLISSFAPQLAHPLRTKSHPVEHVLGDVIDGTYGNSKASERSPDRIEMIRTSALRI